MRFIFSALIAATITASAGAAESAVVRFAYSGVQGDVSAIGYMDIDDALFDGTSFQDIAQSNLVDFNFTMTNATDTHSWTLADLVPASLWFFDSTTATPDIVGQGGFVSDTLSLIASGSGHIQSSLGVVSNTSGDWAYVGPTTPVPLPAALPMLLAAIGGLGFAARRRRA